SARPTAGSARPPRRRTADRPRTSSANPRNSEDPTAARPCEPPPGTRASLGPSWTARGSGSGVDAQHARRSGHVVRKAGGRGLRGARPRVPTSWLRPVGEFLARPGRLVLGPAHQVAGLLLDRGLGLLDHVAHLLLEVLRGEALALGALLDPFDHRRGGLPAAL